MSYKLSIIIPLHNEAENLPALTARLHQTASQLTQEHEIIFVNDGSTDDSEKILMAMHNDYAHVTVINLRERGGKAAALERGFDVATGDYAVIIDSDLQHLPEDIPKLIEKMEEGYDVVSGERTDRHDSAFKVFTSKIFNIIVRLLIRLNFNDYFSGLKCFRMSMMKEINVYGDLFRFVAVLAHQKGFKVTEIPITHHKREHGISKYNFFTRVIRGIQDLIVIVFAIVLQPSDKYKFYRWGLFTAGIGIILILTEFVIHGSRGFSFRRFYGASGCAALAIASISYSLYWAVDYFYQLEARVRVMRRENVKDIIKSV